MNDEHKKTGPKDVFLQLLGILLLYFVAINFGILVFQLINIWLPDPLGHFYGNPYYGPLRWSLSTLFIAFPIYLLLQWYLEKEMLAAPEKRELKSRKWFIYFTLFAATGTIIGDLIVLVYNYLEGELSLRFFLKILTILFIATAVCGYYFWSIRKNMPLRESPKMKVFAWSVIIIVVGLIVTGFVVAGLPQSERARKLDERRVSDLQSFSYEVMNYRRLKGTMPLTQKEVRPGQTWEDPETGVPYEYRVIEDKKFELCADFKTDSSKDLDRAEPLRLSKYGDFGKFENLLRHGTGRTCFTFFIDLDLHRVTTEANSSPTTPKAIPSPAQ